MVTRFCVVCGTEVDDSAAFCPSCGNPLEGPPPGDIPAAPAWPEPDEAAAAAAAAPAPRGTTSPEPQDVEAQPPPAARPGPVAPVPSPVDPGGEPRRPSRNPVEQIDLPFTWPVMLSGWLTGVGSFVAALSVLLDFRSLGNPVTLIAFLLLLAVAATVFLAANMPAIAHRQLWVLVVSIGTFGAAFERIGAGTGFAGAVFFLGTLAAAVGALIAELGRDRPMGGPAA